MASYGTEGKTGDIFDDREKSAEVNGRAEEYVEDADTAKRITRKCDLHILPWVRSKSVSWFIFSVLILNSRSLRCGEFDLLHSYMELRQQPDIKWTY